jgi:hypothetical protein
VAPAVARSRAARHLTSRGGGNGGDPTLPFVRSAININSVRVRSRDTDSLGQVNLIIGVHAYMKKGSAYLDVVCRASSAVTLPNYFPVLDKCPYKESNGDLRARIRTLMTLLAKENKWFGQMKSAAAAGHKSALACVFLIARPTLTMAQIEKSGACRILKLNECLEILLAC